MRGDKQVDIEIDESKLQSLHTLFPASVSAEVMQFPVICKDTSECCLQTTILPGHQLFHLRDSIVKEFHRIPRHPFIFPLLCITATSTSAPAPADLQTNPLLDYAYSPKTSLVEGLHLIEPISSAEPLSELLQRCPSYFATGLRLHQLASTLTKVLLFLESQSNSFVLLHPSKIFIHHNPKTQLGDIANHQLSESSPIIICISAIPHDTNKAFAPWLSRQHPVHYPAYTPPEAFKTSLGAIASKEYCEGNQVAIVSSWNVYALGITLAYCATGVSPSGGVCFAQIISAARLRLRGFSDDFGYKITERNEYHAYWKDVITICLSANPTQRISVEQIYDKINHSGQHPLEGLMMGQTSYPTAGNVLISEVIPYDSLHPSIASLLETERASLYHWRSLARAQKSIDYEKQLIFEADLIEARSIWQRRLSRIRSALLITIVDFQHDLDAAYAHSTKIAWMLHMNADYCKARVILHTCSEQNSIISKAVLADYLLDGRGGEKDLPHAFRLMEELKARFDAHTHELSASGIQAKHKDWDAYRLLMDHNKTNPHRQFLLGLYSLTQDRIHEAIEQFQESHRLYPDSMLPLLALRIIYYHEPWRMLLHIDPSLATREDVDVEKVLTTEWDTSREWKSEQEVCNKLLSDIGNLEEHVRQRDVDYLESMVHSALSTRDRHEFHYAMFLLLAEYEYWYRNDHSRSFGLYSLAVENPRANGPISTHAWNMFAFCMDNGQGTEKNQVKAVQGYTQSSDGGHVSALNNLAYAYEHGEGVSINTQLSVKLYLEAARLGCAAAANSIGICYLEGSNVAKDEQRALSWFRIGTWAGSIYARARLAGMYEKGIAVPMDREMAIRHYRISAKFGDGWSMKQLRRLGV